MFICKTNAIQYSQQTTTLDPDHANHEHLWSSKVNYLLLSKHEVPNNVQHTQIIENFAQQPYLQNAINFSRQTIG